MFRRKARNRVAGLELVVCPDPECLAPAEIVDRWDFSSTDGPIPFVKSLCLYRHHFTVQADRVLGDR